MASAEQMRDHASRLLAMAISARGKGQAEYADRLTEQAADFLAAKAAESVAAQQQNNRSRRRNRRQGYYSGAPQWGLFIIANVLEPRR
jgi:hypothetical protein